jgi:ABC-type sugar transport system permease subunit
VVSTELLTNIWLYFAIVFLLLTIYMADTYFKVKSGTRKPHKSYLQYMTTKRYREIWARQKENPSYYSKRFWITFVWTAICVVRIFHPGL